MMWNAYSKSYLKQNRCSSISIAVTALMAAFFLSLLCSLFYNFWVYEVERIKIEQGDWQGRVIVTVDMDTDMDMDKDIDTDKDRNKNINISKDRLEAMYQFANVKDVVCYESASNQELVIDLYFKHVGRIYEDMPRIAEYLGKSEDVIEYQYHEELLSRYFISAPNDPNPSLLLPFYTVVLGLISLSLILIIRNSFEVTMQARVHQFGILSSIGATPRQILRCLIQEVAILGFIPVLLGIALGAVSSSYVIGAINYYAQDVAERRPASFVYHPLVFGVTFAVSAITVLVSVWIPARKLSKMTPLEAIFNTGSLSLKKRKRSSIFAKLFGIEGELASNTLKAQRKSLWIGSLSLLLSFLSFTLMLSFVTLSDISTRQTYFERYQDAWDVMVTVKGTELTEFDKVDEMKHLLGAESCVMYQKEEGQCLLLEEWQSEEVKRLGGIEKLAESKVVREGENYKISSSIIILDDESFLEYCEQIGVGANLHGSIVLNRIWDNQNSHFRDKKYIPYVKENRDSISLYTKNPNQNPNQNRNQNENPNPNQNQNENPNQNQNSNQNQIDIPILAYTQEVPRLREEYEDTSLVQLLPVSLWNQYVAEMNERNDTKDRNDTKNMIFIRILGQEGIDLEGCRSLQKEIQNLLGDAYKFESENRIEERLSNDRMIQGMKVILGSFCSLLAVIGIANVFSYTLSFLQQRKREFAQYASIGMTPADMKKMFCIEACIIAGRPIAITIPIAVCSILFMVSASHLQPEEFLSEAPVLPVILFASCIAVFVALAYYIGGKRILSCDLSEILKNELI